eukprot:763285-Hanusia_phi.AAC.1
MESDLLRLCLEDQQAKDRAGLRSWSWTARDATRWKPALAQSGCGHTRKGPTLGDWKELRLLSRTGGASTRAPGVLPSGLRVDRWSSLHGPLLLTKPITLLLLEDRHKEEEEEDGARGPRNTEPRE